MRSSAVPGRTVQGVVVEAVSGDPVHAAQVGFAGTSRGVITDTLGVFHLESPDAKVHRLMIRDIGYAAEEFKLDFSEADGYAARIALETTPVRMCIQHVGQVPAITAVVRDARSGKAPTAEVELWVRDGAFEERDVERSESIFTDALVLGVAPWRTGTYDVRVSAPGYEPWQKSSVIVGYDWCNSFDPQTFRIWLLPEGEIIEP